ncbi:MAG: hypothetical protein LUC22_01285, partial [Prevotella sp.]|nr:hypothetical protein [Prevotella sp.]
MTATADEVFDFVTPTNNGDTTNWGDSACTGTLNEDGSITLTLGSDWGAFGWTNWYPGWDLSSYDKIVVEYSNLVFDDADNAENPYIQLYVGGGDGSSSAADYDVTGTIEYVIADHPLVDNDGNELEGGYDNIGQILIQTGAACTVTINSITLVGGLDLSNADYDELPLDELVSGWDSSYDATTQTINYEATWAGRGWWFGTEDNVKDCSAYSGVELVVTTELTGTLQIVVEYDDNNGNSGSATASITGNGANTEQEIYCAFDDDWSAFVTQIYLQSAQTGDVTIVSAKLIKKESSEGEGEGEGEETTGEPVDMSDYFLSLDFEGDNSAWVLYD